MIRKLAIGVFWIIILSTFTLCTFAQEEIEEKAEAKVDKPEAVVTDLSGTVMGYRSETRQWKEARKKDRYTDRDALSTEEESSATLRFHDKHTTVMKENTELTIRQLFRRLDTGEESTELELKRGEILNRVRELPTEGSIYRVHTPTATSSVRGTRFSVKVFQVDGEWVTEIQILEGLVEVVDNAGQIIEMRDGVRLEIDELGVGDRQPEPMGEEEMQQFESALPQVGEAPESIDDTEPLGDIELGLDTDFEGDLEMDPDDIEQEVEDEITDIETGVTEPEEVNPDDDDDRSLF